MNFSDLDEKTENISQEIFDLIEKLYPICRSITGEGVRQTLKIIEPVVILECNSECARAASLRL